MLKRLVRYAGVSALLLALAVVVLLAGGVAWLAPSVMAIVFARLRRQRSALIAAVPLLLGCLALGLSYYTLGGVGQMGLFIFTFVPLLLVVASWVSSGSSRAAVALLWSCVAFAVLLVPFQGRLGARWASLHREARLIATHLEAGRAAEGAYPATLASYTWRSPQHQDVFKYQASGDEFVVNYWVLQPGISHRLSSKTGWSYYPD